MRCPYAPEIGVPIKSYLGNEGDRQAMNGEFSDQIEPCGWSAAGLDAASRAPSEGKHSGRREAT